MSDTEQDYEVLRFLAVLSGIDLLAQGLADIFLTGEIVEIAVGAVLISELVIDSGTLGWAFGWGVLGAAVFLVSPRIFPQQLVTWARGLPGRTALTVGSIGIGIYVSWFLGTLSQFGPSQLTLQGSPTPAVNGGVCRWTPGLSTIQWKANIRHSRSTSPTSGQGDGSPLQNQT